jgi:anaerobic dimethyl sulfoxide reductase subunit B (iron-sulfur subunit)
MSEEAVGIIVDYERCVGCRACEIACMTENKNKGGWIRNVQIGPERVEGKLVRYFMTLMCMHCGDAPCMQVCPAKAITRKPNGVVIIDENLCIGCKFCLWACPFGAPTYNFEKGKMEKCRLCLERLENGMPPACYQTCHVRAIKFGPVSELQMYVRQKAARSIQRISREFFRLPTS